MPRFLINKRNKVTKKVITWNSWWQKRISPKLGFDKLLLFSLFPLDRPSSWQKQPNSRIFSSSPFISFQGREMGSRRRRRRRGRHTICQIFFFFILKLWAFLRFSVWVFFERRDPLFCSVRRSRCLRYLSFLFAVAKLNRERGTKQQQKRVSALDLLVRHVCSPPIRSLLILGSVVTLLTKKLKLLFLVCGFSLRV